MHKGKMQLSAGGYRQFVAYALHLNEGSYVKM